LGVPIWGGGDGMTYADKVLLYSPIGYWKLDESSGTDVLDSSGNAFHGTESGITWSADGIGDGNTAALFDGNNDYADVFGAGLAAAWNTTQGTLLAWFYNTDAELGLRMVASFDEADAGDYAQIYQSSTQRGGVKLGGNSEASAAGVTNAWRAIALAWNVTGNVRRFSIDGETKAASAATLSGVLDLAHAWIGRRNDGRYWKGRIAHVAVFADAKSQDVLNSLTSLSAPPV